MAKKLLATPPLLLRMRLIRLSDDVLTAEPTISEEFKGLFPKHRSRTGLRLLLGDQEQKSHAGNNRQNGNRYTEARVIPKADFEMFTMQRYLQTAEMLKLPVPKLDQGRPITISAPSSPELKRYVPELVGRTEIIKNGRVNPRDDTVVADELFTLSSDYQSRDKTALFRALLLSRSLGAEAPVASGQVRNCLRAHRLPMEAYSRVANHFRRRCRADRPSG